MPPQPAPSSGVKWNEVTWYSKLGAIIFFLGVVPVLCFYIGTQYEAATATYPLPISSPKSQSVTQAPVTQSGIASNCDASASEVTWGDCRSQENTVLRGVIHTFYQKINAALNQYADPSDTNNSRYLTDTAASLKAAETAQNTFITQYCSALTEHYTVFGGTVGQRLYLECENSALIDEQTLLKKLFGNDTDAGKAVPQL